MDRRAAELVGDPWPPDLRGVAVDVDVVFGRGQQEGRACYLARRDALPGVTPGLADHGQLPPPPSQPFAAARASLVLRLLLNRRQRKAFSPGGEWRLGCENPAPPVLAIGLLAVVAEIGPADLL